MKQLTTNSLLSQFQRSHEQELNGCVHFGFDDIDKLLGEIPKATLNIIASRPSAGKSAFIEQTMLNMAIKNKLSVLYFSIEASEYAISNRFLSLLSKIPQHQLRLNDSTANDWQKIEAAANQLKNTTIHLDVTPNIKIEKIIETTTKQCGESKIDVVFIDYLHLITTSNLKTITNREQEIGYIIRELKALAKSLNIRIFVTSPVNRQYVERPLGRFQGPVLSDLRDSGAIEDAADLVLFIHRPEMYGLTETEEGLSTAGLAEIIISKNRYGCMGSINLKFDYESGLFENWGDLYGEFGALESGTVFENKRTESAEEDSPF